MSQTLDPPLESQSLSDQSPLTIGRWWFIWISNLWSAVKATVPVVGNPVKLTAQSAAIVTTVLFTTTQAGLYRISEYARVTTADGVASSLTLTLTWREGSQTCTKAFAALTGDTVTTLESNTWTVYADSGTNISYAYAYTSNTPAKMRFRASLSVEQLTNG